MLFRFRICSHPQTADCAQGWIAAESEISARELLGPEEVQLVLHSRRNFKQLENGTIFLTVGNMLIGQREEV